MTDIKKVTDEQIDALYDRLKRVADTTGYFLHPDSAFAKELVKGLLDNEARYGYQVCPCRLASGEVARDRDIVCPCDYRDADVVEYGSCYCALYVNQAVAQGTQQAGSIPDRRLSALKQRSSVLEIAKKRTVDLTYPVWRCSVCGYLCARTAPPELCPICKVPKERFERFM